MDRTEVVDMRNPLLKDSLVVEGREEVATQLLRYGYSLASGGDMVVVADRGLFIQGTTLSGEVDPKTGQAAKLQIQSEKESSYVEETSYV